MGARGPLRLVTAVTTPEEALEGSAQMDVPAAARKIYKPARVRQSESLSELWDEIVPELVKGGLLTAMDVPAIEVALRHFRAFLSVDEEWHDAGYEPTIMEQNAAGIYQTKKNPLEVSHRSQSNLFLAYCKQLGMTFASRARTSGGDDGSASAGDNPFLPQ